MPKQRTKSRRQQEDEKKKELEEQKRAEEERKLKEAEEARKNRKHPRQIAFEDLRDHVADLTKGVLTRDNRLISRALKLYHVRRRVDTEMLSLAIQHYIPASESAQKTLLQLLSGVKAAGTAAMQVDDEVEYADWTLDFGQPESSVLPEVLVFFYVLVIIHLLDNGKKQQAADTSRTLVHDILPEYNRRTMDRVSAKAFYYFSLSHELIGKLADIRSTLLLSHRTACLRHDEPGQAVLTNAVLRNYLSFNLYAQADKFRLNTRLPEGRSTGEYARYLFYTGKINCVQLHYSEALNNLTQALRKAPQTGAVGFRQQATKLFVIVQLLMGDIPERSTFRQPELERSLRPYFQLTQAVRVGDLAAFKAAMDEHKGVFTADRTYTLIVRLRHNVIKTGLRKINVSYSRISIKDICAKLRLDSAEDAEYVIAKAIHDGVIDAVIDHEKGCLWSKENTDTYSTHEPQMAFDRRIKFCMDIHNSAVKALRFPPNAHKKVLRQISPEDEFID